MIDLALVLISATEMMQRKVERAETLLHRRGETLCGRRCQEWEEAEKLAVEASSPGRGGAKVPFGEVGERESPRAIALKLPKGLELVETKNEAS
jgi:hypothetical protein